MYDAIIITKILMQLLQPKTHIRINANMFFYFLFSRYERDLCAM